ncbi:MAG: sialidase family protein [Pirellulales bacterium]
MSHAIARRRLQNACLAVLVAAVVSAHIATADDNIAKNNVASDDIKITRVFGPEDPGGAYKHPCSITELDNGDLYLTFYGGSGEYGDDTAVYGSRKKKGEDTWSEPAVIADTPDRGEGNPVVWQGPDGTVWLFYVNRYGPTWSNARVKGKISKDGAHTWSDSFMLTFEEGTMARSQPIVLSDGDYLLPLYYETGDDREMTVPTTKSFFLRYDPDAKTWTETNRIASKMGNLQAQVVQLTDNDLVAYIRRGGNFLPTDHGYLLRAESHDGGHTWSDAVETRFQNPNSAVDFIKLQSGNLLLVYNDNMNERTPLTLAISTDGDKTYTYRRNIATGDNTFAYPYAIQGRDGRIHIVCSTDERSALLHFELDEDAIVNDKYAIEPFAPLESP